MGNERVDILGEIETLEAEFMLISSEYQIRKRQLEGQLEIIDTPEQKPVMAITVIEKIRMVKRSAEYRMIRNCQCQISKFADTEARAYVHGLLERRRMELLQIGTKTP